ncbi:MULTISPECIES: alpha/beta fold hydrolase [Actibacterium]|uniref:Pimeloyl-ACP methyl ester carboxylesterase n=1 Tax=Actibacterium naphthalenivorans TaxID=1614693 RepID=A0A840CBA4_9RHOB|nr:MULTISPECIES: alpha/beta fold hydrolase [Actibacterium]MBB4022360.1 pimeloyl-ACP methyl ester carboxylesterase [Actibacterium naphthalenivorans]
MTDVLTHPGAAPADRSLAARLMSGGMPAQDVVVIAAAERRPDGPFAQFRRSMRERFQAITNVGLTHPASGQAALARHDLPGRNGLPALSYLAAGDSAGRPVVFIHGTPGEASDWAPFLRRAPAGQHRLAIDRPGFGRSGPGAPVVALPEQARAIAALLEAGPGPAVVVGSSYGGPVALQLAANHPDLVSGVLLVGAAADPVRERTHPAQRLAALRAVSSLLPRPLVHSNAELLVLRRELEALGQRIGRIRAPVTILQGLHDTLVPAENAAYLAERLVGVARRRVVLVERAGHFLHILRSTLVEDTLRHLLAESKTPGPAPAALS